MKTFLKWKGSNFLRKCKNMKNATGYFCVKETLFSGIVKNPPSSESIKLIVFECRTGFVFQALFSYSWLLWCCMKYSILPPGLRVFFFLWKQAPFRWCVLKIQKDLTRKMGFLHFCCWITKCNFEKEKSTGCFNEKKNKCQITIPLKDLFSKEKGKYVL